MINVSRFVVNGLSTPRIEYENHNFSAVKGSQKVANMKSFIIARIPFIIRTFTEQFLSVAVIK